MELGWDKHVQAFKILVNWLGIPKFLYRQSKDPPEPHKCVKAPEPTRVEVKAYSGLKNGDSPSARHVPAKIQEPLYAKAAPKVNKVFVSQVFQNFIRGCEPMKL